MADKKKNSTWTSMPLMAMLGIQPEQDFNQMVSQASPVPPQSMPEKAMPKDMVATKQMLPMDSVALQPGETSRSYSEKRTVANPSLSQKADELRQKFEALSASRMGAEQAGIDKYRSDMDKYANQPQRMDFTGLASVLDRFGNGSLTKAAQDLRPESREEKQAKLQAMQQQLQGMESGLSKSQMDAMKDQLGSYQSEMNANTAEARLMAGMNSKAIAQKSLDDRTGEKWIQQLAKQTEGKAALNTSLDTLEANLGFAIDDYDTKSGTVGGKKVDFAGVSVPGIGRVDFYSEKSRRIEDALSNIFNITLHDRSGAAVTSTEMVRLQKEFSAGRFQTEAEKIQAIKDFKRAANEAINRAESAFNEKTRQTYKERLASDSNKISDQTPVTSMLTSSTGSSATAGFPTDKAARLELLRAKKAAGEIK